MCSLQMSHNKDVFPVSVMMSQDLCHYMHFDKQILPLLINNCSRLQKNLLDCEAANVK